MSSKRKRLDIIYKELSSESDIYNIIENIEDIPSDTSSWNQEHLFALKIRYHNAEKASSIVSTTNLNDRYKMLLLESWDRIKFEKNNINQEITNLDKSVASLIIKAKQIINLRVGVAKKEVRVDGFVMSLLNFLEFDNYPCTMYPQYTYTAKFNNKKISSKVEFIVTNLDKYVLLIVEDKHEDNTGAFNNWSENQLAGEIFGCAYHCVQMSEFNPRSNLKFPIVLHAIRVIGTLFTFYKTEVSKAYIEECYRRLPLKTQLNIIRYPEMPKVSEDTLTPIIGLDFCQPSERTEILEILNAIRNRVEI